MYDVVAVLEGVGMLARKKMNLYRFCGRSAMEACFVILRESAAAQEEDRGEAEGEGEEEEAAGASSRKDKSLLVLTKR